MGTDRFMELPKDHVAVGLVLRPDPVPVPRGIDPERNVFPEQLLQGPLTIHRRRRLNDLRRSRAHGTMANVSGEHAQWGRGRPATTRTQKSFGNLVAFSTFRVGRPSLVGGVSETVTPGT
jgi:hypothetical protein